MAKKNPGVSVLAMNPAPAPRKKRKQVAKRREKKRVTRRRKHNPGNPGVVRRRRRRKHNPGAGSVGGTLKRVAMAALGALGVMVARYGLSLTSLEPKTRSLILAGGSLALGGGLAYAANEDVGASVAATGIVVGGNDYMSSPGGYYPPAPSKKLRNVKRPTRALQGMYGDDDAVEALGLVTAAMSGLDDDEELAALGMGAVTADLEGVDDEEDYPGMGAVTADLEGVDDEGLEGVDDEEDYPGMGAVEEEALFS